MRSLHPHQALPAWLGRVTPPILIAMIVAVGAAAPAAAESGFASTDWTETGANVATGSLLGATVTLSGSHVSDPPGSNLGGTSHLFGGPYFTPPLPSSDAIEIRAAAPAYSYTLHFGAPTINPVLHIGSLGSTLEFASGTTITRLGGKDDGFAVSGSTITGAAHTTSDAYGENDSSGTVRLNGTFHSIAFTATSAGFLDGIYLQVGVSVAGPQTEITLDPAEPPPAGVYLGHVGVRVSAIDGAGTGSVQTRCALDPAAPPVSFDDLPLDCPFLSGGTIATAGLHTIYAASRDSFGSTDGPVSRTFRIVFLPDTTITDGPSGLTWEVMPQFSFTSTLAGSTFQCQLDGGAFFACATPYRTPTHASGSHRLVVRAVSPEGYRDPFPAARSFVLGTPTGKQLSCEVRPVYWNVATRDFKHPNKYACEIRSPSDTGGQYTGPGSWPWDTCTTTNVCVPTNQDCPVGALCTLTTKLSWYDADLHFNWDAIVEAAQDPASGSWGEGYTRNAYTPHVRSINSCATGWDGDRCFATASISAFGDGTPLWTGCSASLLSTGAIGVSTFRDDSVRRIECDADLQIAPAVPLSAVATALIAEVYASFSGRMVAKATILGSSDRRARASATRRPKIASVRKVVTRPGAVSIPLKLNAPAKRLLKRRKKLVIRMRVTLTGDGGASLTRTTRLTLRKPKALPRFCIPHRTPKRSRRAVRCVRAR